MIRQRMKFGQRTLFVAVAAIVVGLTGCGGTHVRAAVRVEVKVNWGAFTHKKSSAFALTCRPADGTLPFAARVCSDIAKHPSAMLNPATPRWSCSGAAGAPQLSVTAVSGARTRKFAGQPWCDWPTGPTLEVYWAAINHDVKSLNGVEPTLRCEEDPTLLARPTPLASAVACVHGLWTPRSEHLIRLAATVISVSHPAPVRLFPHDVGVQNCSFVGAGLSTRTIHGRCGVVVDHVWSIPTVTFVETWPSGSHVRRHRWVVQIKNGRPHLTRQSGPVPPQYWV